MVGMGKVFVTALAILTVCASLCADSLSFEPAGGDVSFSSPVVSWSSSSGYMSMRLGPLVVGALADNDLVQSILSLHHSPWSGWWQGEGQEVGGLALSFDEVAWFALTKPQQALGFSLSLNGFVLGYAHAWPGEVDDSLFMSHDERGGYGADTLLAGYRGEHLMAQGRLSITEDVGVNLMGSIGLQAMGVGAIYTRGKEANIAAMECVMEESWRFFLSRPFLRVALSLEYYGRPVRPATYREIESRLEVECRPYEDLVLWSRQKSSYRQRGWWDGQVAYGLKWKGQGIGWDSEDGFSLSLSFDGLSFTISGSGFSVGYEARLDWLRLRFSLDSGGKVDTSLTLHF